MRYRIPDRTAALALAGLCHAGLLQGRVGRAVLDGQPWFVLEMEKGAVIPAWIERYPEAGKRTKLLPVIPAELIASSGYGASSRQGVAAVSWGESAIAVFPALDALYEVARRHLEEGALSLRFGHTARDGSDRFLLHILEPRINLTVPAVCEAGQGFLYWQALRESSFWFAEEGTPVTPGLLPSMADRDFSGHMLIGRSGDSEWIPSEWTGLESILKVVPTSVVRPEMPAEWRLSLPPRLVPVPRTPAPSLWEIPHGPEFDRVLGGHDISLWEQFSFWSTADRIVAIRHGEDQVVEAEAALGACGLAFWSYGPGTYIPEGHRLRPAVPPQDLPVIMESDTDGGREQLFHPDMIRLLADDEEGNVRVVLLDIKAAKTIQDILRFQLAREIARVWDVGDHGGLDDWKRDLPITIPVPDGFASSSSVADGGRDGSSGPAVSDIHEDGIVSGSTGRRLRNVSGKNAGAKEQPPPQHDSPDEKPGTDLFGDLLRRWNTMSQADKSTHREAVTQRMSHGSGEFTPDDWLLTSARYHADGDSRRSLAAWAQWVLTQPERRWYELTCSHPAITDVLADGGESAGASKTGFEELRRTLGVHGVDAEIAYLLLCGWAIVRKDADRLRRVQDKLLRDYVRGVDHTFGTVLPKADVGVLRGARRSAVDLREQWEGLHSESGKELRVTLDAQLDLLLALHGVEPQSQEQTRELPETPGGDLWSLFCGTLGQSAMRLRESPPEDPRSIALWWRSLNAQVLREGASGSVVLSALFDRLPPQATMDQMSSRLVDQLSSGRVQREQLFPNENELRRVVNTRIVLDMVEQMGPSDSLKPLLLPLQHPEEGDTLQVTHNAILYRLYRSFGESDQSLEAETVFPTNFAALGTVDTRPLQESALALLAAAYVMDEPQRTEMIKWLARSVLHALVATKDDESRVFLHRFIASAQTGTLYSLFSEETRRAVFEIRRRALWTGAAARLIQTSLEDIS